MTDNKPKPKKKGRKQLYAEPTKIYWRRVPESKHEEIHDMVEAFLKKYMVV